MPVEFEEENIQSTMPSFAKSTKKHTGLIRFLIDYHLAKNEKSANIILILLFIVLLMGTTAVYIFVIKAQTQKEVRYEIPVGAQKYLPPSLVEKINNQKKK